MIALLLPSLHQVINILLPLDQGGVDDLPVEECGAPGHGGEQPDDQDHLALVVKRKPKPKEQVADVLCQGEYSEHYPVGHPVHIVLTRGNKNFLKKKYLLSTYLHIFSFDCLERVICRVESTEHYAESLIQDLAHLHCFLSSSLLKIIMLLYCIANVFIGNRVSN